MTIHDATAKSISVGDVLKNQSQKMTQVLKIIFMQQILFKKLSKVRKI